MPIYFNRMDANGNELWVSDGTVAGTHLVRDINSGAASSNPDNLVDLNNTLYFAADDGVSGRELWKSDGTSGGTVQVKDINAGSAASSPSSMIATNGSLFFAADDGVNGSELWKSDGTANGTALLSDIWSGAGSSSPSGLTNVNGQLYFSAYTGPGPDPTVDPGAGVELWTSDGTSGGTHMAANIKDDFSPLPFTSPSSYPHYLTAVGDTVYFAATGNQRDGSDDYGGQLYSYSASGGLSQLGDYDQFPANLVNVNGTLFYTAYGYNMSYTDRELFTTGVGEINIRPGQDSSNPGSLTAIGSEVFFSADDGSGHGVELWKSDGTAVGTVMVRDIRPGPDSSGPADLVNVNGTLFFGADDGSGHGFELWKSDGTAAGTVMVKDINPGPGGFLTNQPENMYASGGILYFGAFDGSVYGLWRSDGTDAGTYELTGGFGGQILAFGPSAAQNDAVATFENAALNGSVFADNGSGPDTSFGTALAVAEVNGSAANVGTEITLPSGALLMCNADGSFSFDPHGVYDALPAPGSGATNTTATDHFTYTLVDGAVATVTITTTGVDSNDVLFGSTLDDTLSAGIGIDELFGYAGNDTLIGGPGQPNTMFGGPGNDLYVVQAQGDSVVELPNEGTDTVQTSLPSFTLPANVENLTHTGSSDFVGVGNEFNNLLIGGTGNDYLIGGSGNDTFIDGSGLNTFQGGAGNDIYAVQSSTDSVFEFPNEGIDQVQTFLPFYHLPSNVENLTLVGSGTHIGIGNELDNLLIGGSGDDYLIGLDGNDTFIDSGGLNTFQGGAGDDLYIVQSPTDSVTEFANEGTDEVETFLASYVLPANVENLVFVTGIAHTGTGNALANTFTGSSGNDTFTGAGGADVFNYRTAGNGLDTITDFNADNTNLAEHDHIDLTGRGLDFASLAVTDRPEGVMIGIPGGDAIFLKNVAAHSIDAGDFFF